MDKTAKSMANDVPPGFANRPSFIAISARRPASAREALGQRPQSWVYTHAERNPTHLGAIGSLPERSFVGPGGGRYARSIFTRMRIGCHKICNESGSVHSGYGHLNARHRNATALNYNCPLTRRAVALGVVEDAQLDRGSRAGAMSPATTGINVLFARHKPDLSFTILLKKNRDRIDGQALVIVHRDGSFTGGHFRKIG